MGCDIHLFVEYEREMPVKDSPDNTRQWISGDYFMQNPYFEVFDDEGQLEHVPLYRERNYFLFNVLAGVRSHDHSITPISEPKGVPVDSCPYIQEEYESWDSDGHSHSWLTLGELIEYQANNAEIQQAGWLSPKQIEELDKDGITPEYWKLKSEPGYKAKSWTQKNTILIPLIELLTKRAKELITFFDVENSKHLKTIRIVFWFDN
jgi:hypothetical protein